MYTAMESFKEGHRLFQRALRVTPFLSLEKAMEYAMKRAKGKPFVSKGLTIVWVG